MWRLVPEAAAGAGQWYRVYGHGVGVYAGVNVQRHRAVPLARWLEECHVSIRRALHCH